MTGDPTSVEGVDLDGIRRYLQDQPLRFALLFGSRSRGAGDGSSDVDVTVAFEDGLDKKERFRRRNRIDADLQAYAAAQVDVNDFETLPMDVARQAVREGVLLVGDERTLRRLEGRLEDEFESTEGERRRERRRTLERLSSGDT